MDIFKVVSFNMRRQTRFDRKYRWQRRKEIAAEVIRRSGASVVGVQELLPGMRRDVSSLLDDYSIIGSGRFQARDASGNEHADILIKNEDASVSFYQTFWLSNHPEVESRAYFAAFPRICTVAEIHLKKLDRRIRVFNTHFDHVCGPARTLGVKIILECMERFNQKDPLPTILMGDLNAKPTSRPITILRENLHHFPTVHLNDVYTCCPDLNIQNTYRGFWARIKKLPIDYIFVSDEFEVEQVAFDNLEVDGRYPSDHYPVSATLRLKP